MEVEEHGRPHAQPMLQAHNKKLVNWHGISWSAVCHSERYHLTAGRVLEGAHQPKNGTGVHGGVAGGLVVVGGGGLVVGGGGLVVVGGGGLVVVGGGLVVVGGGGLVVVGGGGFVCCHQHEMSKQHSWHDPLDTCTCPVAPEVIFEHMTAYSRPP